MSECNFCGKELKGAFQKIAKKYGTFPDGVHTVTGQPKKACMGCADDKKIKEDYITVAWVGLESTEPTEFFGEPIPTIDGNYFIGEKLPKEVDIWCGILYEPDGGDGNEH